jgi:transcriptional regulator with XRE-family HTH domain
LSARLSLSTTPKGFPTLPAVRFDRKKLGERIAQARLKKGITSQAELCRKLIAVLERRGGTSDSGKNPKQTLTAMSVNNWEKGTNVPSMEMLAVLAAFLEVDEEWLLFGSERNSDIKQERFYLSRVTEEEGRLLTAFREASKAAQKAIVDTAMSIAKASPAPNAQVHQLRRKDDKATNG